MSAVHVYPPDDIVEHDTDGDDCWCGPRTEFSQGDEGSGWVIFHHSIDGREFNHPLPHACDECGRTWGSPNAADACCSDTYDRGRE